MFFKLLVHFFFFWVWMALRSVRFACASSGRARRWGVCRACICFILSVWISGCPRIGGVPFVASTLRTSSRLRRPDARFCRLVRSGSFCLKERCLFWFWNSFFSVDKFYSFWIFFSWCLFVSLGISIIYFIYFHDYYYWIIYI